MKHSFNDHLLYTQHCGDCFENVGKKNTLKVAFVGYSLICEQKKIKAWSTKSTVILISKTYHNKMLYIGTKCMRRYKKQK